MQAAFVAFLCLWAVRCYTLNPVMTSVGLRHVELRLNDLVGENLMTAIHNMDNMFNKGNTIGKKEIGELRHSMNEIYYVYSGIYIAQNASLAYSIPVLFADFYARLKLFLALLTKVGLPIRKSMAARIEIFPDLLPFLKGHCEKLALLDEVLQRPKVGENQLSILSTLYRANERYISDEEIYEALSKMPAPKEYEMLHELCNQLLSQIQELMKRCREGSRFKQVLLSQQPTFGNHKFLKAMALFRFMGRLETVEISKYFPSYPSQLECILIANTRLVEEARSKEQNVDDYSPEDKDLYGILSLLHGTTIFEVLYDTDFERRFSQYPMVMMFNNNSECFQFKATMPNEVLYHLNNGRNVYLYNYAQVCGSVGETNLSSMFHDSQGVASRLITRFALAYPYSHHFTLGFHGTSLGGMYATKTASHIEESHPAGLTSFAILQKTFGSLHDMAWYRMGWFGGLLARLYGASIDLYKIYTKLRMKKVTIFEVNDTVVHPNYSLSGHVALGYFKHLLPEVTEEFQELASLCPSADFVVGGDEKSNQVAKFFHALNSAGQTLLDWGFVAQKTPFMKELFMSAFTARMLAFGSLPTKHVGNYIRNLRLPFLWTLLSETSFVGMSAGYDRADPYINVPGNVALLFNMLFGGKPALTPGAHLHQTITVASGGPDMKKGNASITREPAIYRIRWPKQSSYAHLNTPNGENSILELLSADLASFGFRSPVIDGVRIYAWMQLYTLLHTVALVNAVRLYGVSLPDVSAKMEEFAEDIMRLGFGVQKNPELRELLQRPVSPPEILDTSFFGERYRTFGNLITTYTKHSAPIETNDMKILSTILGE
ncbi:uncharacterized protein BXIN_0765 [Babesia sp. Xinjiang]|uniref:uncharacterized protein n=1 Tax=Babesia sp. Xinjiang TaxID=462227 RepID=UPI000A230622|nr:uncharacterized protein BXIN_0765 [Babesia sp. Xinjiang]ORM41357.1 hypothetical protein BXIN_0765 [Babesia sp. Xinjiang]